MLESRASKLKSRTIRDSPRSEIKFSNRSTESKLRTMKSSIDGISIHAGRGKCNHTWLVGNYRVVGGRSWFLGIYRGGGEAHCNRKVCRKAAGIIRKIAAGETNLRRPSTRVILNSTHPFLFFPTFPTLLCLRELLYTVVYDRTGKLTICARKVVDLDSITRVTLHHLGSMRRYLFTFDFLKNITFFMLFTYLIL